MKSLKIFIVLLVLVSSFFIINILESNNFDITELTTRAISNLNSKATAVLIALSISADATPPTIYIDSPKNKIYNQNVSINLNFTIVDDNLDKIYYNLNDDANTTITANITFGAPSGYHTLKLFANDTFGHLNSSSVSFRVNLSHGWNISFFEFTGSTTNFSASNITQLMNLSNVVLENPNHGKISFNENINISQDVNIDQYANISFNRIELQSEFLSMFNKSATLRIYNLTFSNPKILRDGVECSSSICVKNSYSGGTLDFNVTGFSTYFSSEETTTVSSSGSPGGGGGSSGGGKTISSQGITTLENFKTDKEFIKVSLLQGETKRELLEIENTGVKTLDLSFDLEDISEFLIFQTGLSRYDIKLNPGEKKSLQLMFNIAKNQKPGAYHGRIIVNSGESKKTINVLIEIESAIRIFDVGIRLPKKEVIKGGSMDAEILVFRLAGDEERVDTQIEFGIKTLEGNIIVKEDARIAVQTQASFIENILIPNDIEEELGDEFGTASETFRIVDEKDFITSHIIYVYILPPLALLILIIIFQILKQRAHNRREHRKKYIKEEIISRQKKEDFINKKDIVKARNKLDILNKGYKEGMISRKEYLKLKKKFLNEEHEKMRRELLKKLR